MTFFSPQHVSSRLDFLICTLLVLVPTDELFRKLSLSTDLFLTSKGQNYILQNWKEIKELLNDELLRQFSYILIRPVLFKDLVNEPLLDIETKKEFKDGVLLLKNYLKKFKAFYKHYFLNNKNSTHRILTEKEINYFAIEALFLLVGV